MNAISPPRAAVGVASAADLASRAVIAVAGAEWRAFLQGLVTQDVETLASGEIRFAALLTPQGRLLFDLFLVGQDEGVLIDCAAEHRGALVSRLRMYRLRAKVEITPSDMAVAALWRSPVDDGASASGEALPEDPRADGWARDPRAPGLGLRGYGAPAVPGALPADEAAYERHRFALGLPGPADWGHDRSYPIEANFDLLGGIDFRKGCFVGQETTSRKRRRGTVKSRMAPIAFSGPPPAPRAGLLAGELRAGQVLSGETWSAEAGGAMALLRLDRLGEGPLTLEDGRPFRVAWPAWMEGVRPG
jgi:folate-binding protein YgfZ